MIRPVQMKRFYLAVPSESEEEVVKKIGELGVAHLIREIPIEREERTRTAEICRKFIRLHERMHASLGQSSAQKPSEGINFDLDQVESLVDQTETELDESMAVMKKREEETTILRAAEEKLGFLKAQGLRADEIGDFRHIFVKAGFMKNELVTKLDVYLSGTSVTYVSKAGRTGERFLAVTGLNEDRALTESALKFLNFEELTLPKGLEPEPDIALSQIEASIEAKEKEIQNLKQDLSVTKERLDSLQPSVLEALQIEEAKGFAARTKTKSLIHGWIPSDKVDFLKTKIGECVEKEKTYWKIEDPNPYDKVPVKFENKGLLGSFESFTNLQGMPNYFEINPTVFYMFLYPLMFGLMFGDMGDGAVFIIIGLILIRLRRGLFNFSPNTIRKLGQIIVSCGAASFFFGILDGQFFLVEVLTPTLNPLGNIAQIVTIALIFGVIQICIALSLGIINKVRRKESLKAVLGGKGLIGLVYYLSGVGLATVFIRDVNFNVFFRQDIIPFTFIAVFSLAIIFLSPAIETLIERRNARLSEKFTEGFGEGLETFISYISNSVSYIRLAAFAIAHESLGLAAAIFAPTIGVLPSYLLINIISFLVEGFAALIQSLRLMYYEFSTKFYAGDGMAYKPFRTIMSKQKT